MGLFTIKDQQAGDHMFHSALRVFRAGTIFGAPKSEQRPETKRALIAAAISMVLFGPARLTAGLPKPWPAVAPHGAVSSASSLPAGTILYLRLKTPVSTTTSHLGAAIEAEEVRDVEGSGGVAVPIGSIVRGKIITLIPSSSPMTRAMMAFEFETIQMPGLGPQQLSCRLATVENARETVLANGMVQGVLAGELPSSYLQGELAKINQSNSSIGAVIAKLGSKELGQTDTAIRYPAGTDFQVVLKKPLEIQKWFPPAASSELSPDDLAALQRLLAASDNRVKTKDGKPGDPINLALIGTQAEIRQAFQKAGWTVPKDKNPSSIWRTIRAVTGNLGYDAAPLSDLYLFGRPEDMAYEKTLNTFTMRHHLRLWRSPVSAPDGTPIWLGATTHDIGFDIRPGVISHATSPHLDNERAKVGADLIVTGMVSAEQLVSRPNPLTSGLTGTGGAWHTDGRVLAIAFKRD
jgi:hypothetical protein